MEKICKYCSNYNKGKCSILNEKLSTDISFSYWGVLNIIENFFNDNFRLYLPPEDLQELASQLSNKIDSFIIFFDTNSSNLRKLKNIHLKNRKNMVKYK